MAGDFTGCILDLNRTLACGFDEECSIEISSIQFIQFIEENRIKLSSSSTALVERWDKSLVVA